MDVFNFKLKNHKRFIWIGSTLLILGIFFAFLAIRVNKDVIYPNIKIQGIDVGHLHKEEAKQRLKENFEHTLKDKRIGLGYKGEIWEYGYQDFGGRYEYDRAIQQAFEIGRDGHLFYRMKSFIKLTLKGQEILLRVDIQDEALHHILDEIGGNILKPSADAQIEYKEGQFIISPEIYGENLQKKEAFNLVKGALARGSEDLLELPTENTPPRITEGMLKAINKNLATFSTNYNPAAKERAENLKIAAGMINGQVLLPGDIFSAYELIGPITEANGYKNAPVIVNGALEPGIGGGVCQITTTVFNAAVKADLEIVERRHHSFPVSYVPLGQDATIAGDWIDFKFKNNFSHPIYIQMYLSGGKVVINIYGNSENSPKDIQLETEVLSKIHASVNYRKDPSQYTDYKKIEREARTGYKVNVYKVTYESGKEKKRELLHYDYYKPVDGIVIIGTQERQTKNSADKEVPGAHGEESQRDMEEDEKVE